MRRTHTWRRSLLALAGCLLVCALVVQAGLAAPTTQSAGTENVSITVTNATVGDDGTTTLQLSLSGAPNGLAGYQLTATFQTAGVASVATASYPDQYGLTTDPVVTRDGQSVTLEAADLSGAVAPGATDIPLATVVVSGDAAGQTVVELTDVQVDDDNGGQIAVAADSGVVTVGSDTSTSPTETTSSRNGDTAVDSESEGNSNALGPSAGIVVLTVGSVFFLVAALLASRSQ